MWSISGPCSTSPAVCSVQRASTSLSRVDTRSGCRRRGTRWLKSPATTVGIRGSNCAASCSIRARHSRCSDQVVASPAPGAHMGTRPRDAHRHDPHRTDRSHGLCGQDPAGTRSGRQRCHLGERPPRPQQGLAPAGMGGDVVPPECVPASATWPPSGSRSRWPSVTTSRSASTSRRRRRTRTAREVDPLAHMVFQVATASSVLSTLSTPEPYEGLATAPGTIRHPPLAGSTPGPRTAP